MSYMTLNAPFTGGIKAYVIILAILGIYVLNIWFLVRIGGAARRWCPRGFAYGRTWRLQQDDTWSSEWFASIGRWEIGRSGLRRHPLFAPFQTVRTFVYGIGGVSRVRIIRYNPAAGTYTVEHHQFGRSVVSASSIDAIVSVRRAVEFRWWRS